MKRKYIQPVSDVLRCDMEQSILAGSLTISQDHQEYDAESSYSNERGGWDSSEWE